MLWVYNALETLGSNVLGNVSPVMASVLAGNSVCKLLRDVAGG